MAGIQDHQYLKVCAEIARCLSISLSSARRRVDLLASQKGVRDVSTRIAIAEELLEEVRLAASSDDSSSKKLDSLLEVLAEEDNFMVED